MGSLSGKYRRNAWFIRWIFALTCNCMIAKVNTLIELNCLMKTWFRKLVFNCISLRRILIIQWSSTCRVRTLLFFFTLSCTAAKCGNPLGKMNFQKSFKRVLITCSLNLFHNYLFLGNDDSLVVHLWGYQSSVYFYCCTW